MKLYQPLIGLLALSLCGSPYAEDHQYTPESEQLLEQLQGNIKGTLLAVAENEKRAGYDMADFRFSVEIPPQQMTNLGLILDVDHSAEGYKVLSVTPGSTADKLAIKSGDQILAINDVKIDDTDDKNAIKQLNQLVAGDQIKLALNNNGNYKEFSTTITGQYIPGVKLEIGSQSAVEGAMVKQEEDSQACGEVSIFFLPPVTKNLYSASISKIDDNYLKRDYASFRLPVGKHTIYLHERIDDPVFPVRNRGFNRAKTIEIDVKENITYHLGAKFIRKYRLNGSSGRHWNPVVWKTSEKVCNL